MQLKRNITDYNNRALCQYIEPECPELYFSKLTKRLLSTCCPRTVALSEAVAGTFHRRDFWGVEHLDGRFSTISTRTRQRGGRPLTSREVLRTFLGKHGALTSSDAPYQTADGWCSYPKMVYTLRVDVDFDRAWRDEDETAILAEVRREQQICRDLGLTSNVFKTGRRGHQLVIGLPDSVPFHLASFFMELYKAAHGPRTYDIPPVDKTNLTGQMRLPGGQHRVTGDLGLFIDADEGSLYDLRTQCDLMVRAFEIQSDSCELTGHTFGLAAQQILDWLAFVGISSKCSVDESHVLRALSDLRGNELLRRFEDSFPTLSYTNIHPAAQQTSPQPEAPKLERGLSGSGYRWARATFDIDVQPGEFWSWVNMGGKKGILAAHILFGDESLAHLLEKARNTEARTPKDLTERLAMVRSLHQSFVPVGVSNSFRVVKVQECYNTCLRMATKLRSKHKFRKRLISQYAAVLAVLLTESKESARSWVRLSHDSIAKEIAATFPNLQLSPDSVGRRLSELVCFGALKVSKRRVATSVAYSYFMTSAARHADEFIELP